MHSRAPTTSPASRACRSTSLASSSRFAPIRWATWTEKPVAREMHMPPSSQVEVDTRPMEAEALAPRLPTMAASMYCMAMELICARMAGTLSVSTCTNCSLQVSGGRPGPLWDRACSSIFRSSLPLGRAAPLRAADRRSSRPHCRGWREKCPAHSPFSRRFL